MLKLLSTIPLLIAVSCGVQSQEQVYLTMGFRVGEITQTSAVVWTRICRDPKRREDGIREVGRPGPKSDEYVPPEVAVEDREGSVPGADGDMRVLYSVDPEMKESVVGSWTRVSGDDDFVGLVTLDSLSPGQKYHVRVEARSLSSGQVTSTEVGSFQTAAAPEVEQEVTFVVITGQAYLHLDHPEGYSIYPSMQKIEPQFLVATGDTVYYDNELPRARTVELARYHWHRMYSLPRIVEFHKSVPGYWLKDDHDVLSNDTWPGENPEWMKPMTFEAGQEIFREQVPVGKKPFRTVRWGKDLQIWLVEGRDFRSPNDLEDGPEKTIWGKEQLEWLKETLVTSDASYRLLISPTPVVGPDRERKNDNHANSGFSYEGSHFRNWVKEQELSNFYVICGDRHWQYFSIDPASGLREFSCGPVSDEHAGGSPGEDTAYHRFHRVNGGFLSVRVTRTDGRPGITFHFHDVPGNVVYEYSD